VVRLFAEGDVGSMDGAECAGEWGWWGDCKWVLKHRAVCAQPFPTSVILGNFLKS